MTDHQTTEDELQTREQMLFGLAQQAADADYDLDPVWVCGTCGWEGDPDKVSVKCPGCGREIRDDEP